MDISFPFARTDVAAALLGLLASLPSGPATAQERTAPEATVQDVDAGELDLDARELAETLDLPEISVEVHARPDEPESQGLDQRDVHWGYGEAIVALPGVSASRRAAGAAEPVIRGLGQERVLTQAGPVPLLSACPSSMDPPVAYFSAHSASAVEVVRGLPSVRLGPGGTGGRVILSPGQRLQLEEPGGVQARLAQSVDFARGGTAVNGQLSGGSRRLALSLGSEFLRLGDYRSGAGTLVPAGQERYGASLTLVSAPAPGRRLWTTASWTHEEEVDFPSLPMDNDDTDFWLVTLGYRRERVDGPLRAVQAEAGVALTDHLMSNRNKPNRHRLRAATTSDVVALGGRWELTWRLRPRTKLYTGLDLVGAARDAFRERFVVAANRRFTDHLWPQASQWGVGLFAELRQRLTPSLSLRAGGRGSLFRSNAEGTEDPALAGQTVAEAWASFWGPEAAQARRLEGTGGALLTLLWRPRSEVSLHWGTSLAMRPAGLTERYFAYGPAPGGYLVGNPGLKTEIKWETVAGLRAHLSWLQASASVFCGWLPTYILRTGVAERDVDGDGQTELIRSFENISAQLLGAELTALVQAGPYFAFPLSLSYVRGWNRDRPGDLALIPPFEASVAARLRSRGTIRGWLELGARFVAPQRQVDQGYPENETPGFTLLQARGSVVLDDRLRLVLAVHNLLDREYHEHLTHQALLPAGDLAAGDEVPAPGRRVTLSLVGILP